MRLQKEKQKNTLARLVIREPLVGRLFWTTVVGGFLKHSLCDLHKIKTASTVSRMQCRNVALLFDDLTTGEWEGQKGLRLKK